MQDSLDNQNVISQKDPFDALGVAANEWQQLEASVDVHGDVARKEFSSIIVTGMGGSALAAGMAKDLLYLKIPFEIVKGYVLPAYVSESTLVIASSYSGNTEETVAALALARERGATSVVIAAGGALIDTATSDKLPFVQLPAGIQPRMAVFANLKALMAILEAYGITENAQRQLGSTAQWLKEESSRWVASVPSEYNLAKQLAMHAAGKTPVIYAGTQMRSIAYKWKISFNENAKNVAFCNELPEFNHNEFLGWTSHPVDKAFAIFDLRSGSENPRIAKRFELTEKLLSGKRPKAHVVELEGNSPIDEMLWGSVLADFVSIYLAILNGVDPTKVELIEKLKAELGKP